MQALLRAMNGFQCKYTANSGVVPFAIFYATHERMCSHPSFFYQANATKCVTTAASEDVLSETGAVLSPSGHAVPSIEDGTSANQAGRPGVRTESKQDTLPPNTDQRIERANTDKSSYSRQDHDGTRENAKAKESAATQLSRIHKLKARFGC